MPRAAGLRNLGEDYRLISIPRDGDKPPAWELPAVLVADAAEDDLVRLEKSAPKSDAWRIICLLDGEAHPPAKLKSRIFAVLPRQVPCLVLEKTVEKAFENLRAQEEHDRTRRELRRAVSDLETLNKIGVALSTERNTDSLLELILSKSREITSADAGSLYLVEEESERRQASGLQADAERQPFGALSPIHHAHRHAQHRRLCCGHRADPQH